MRTERVRETLPGTSYRSRLLGVLFLGWAGLQAGRFLLPPLLPRIQASLGLSTAGAGLALAAFGLVYAVAQYPAGSYSDGLSRASLILPGFVVLVAGFAMVAVAVSPWLFLGAVVLLGVGKGLYASPSRALLGDLFTDRRGRALGVYSAGTDVGGLAAAGIAAVVLASPGWRSAFVPVVVALVAVTALFVVWNREPYRAGRIDLAPGGTFRRVLATRGQREVVVAYALFYFMVGGLTNFYPAMLVETRGMDPALASAVFALLFVVGLVTKPTAGAVSDRLPRLAVGVGGLLLAAAGFAVFLLAPGLPGIAAGTVMVAVGYKTQFPISDALVIEAAPAANVGGDLGAARGIFLTAAAVGPAFVGVVAERASFEVAFWALAATLLASAGLLARQHLR